MNSELNLLFKWFKEFQIDGEHMPYIMSFKLILLWEVLSQITRPIAIMRPNDRLAKSNWRSIGVKENAILNMKIKISCYSWVCTCYHFSTVLTPLQVFQVAINCSCFKIIPTTYKQLIVGWLPRAEPISKVLVWLS